MLCYVMYSECIVTYSLFLGAEIDRVIVRDVFGEYLMWVCLKMGGIYTPNGNFKRDYVFPSRRIMDLS